MMTSFIIGLIWTEIFQVAESQYAKTLLNPGCGTDEGESLDRKAAWEQSASLVTAQTPTCKVSARLSNHVKISKLPHPVFFLNI